MTALFADVPGQHRAVAALTAAAHRPVHAYLFAGPAGTGKAAAARSFAAMLLCPNGGDGTCETCRRVLAGSHPDVVTVEREGAFITVEAARDVARLAARSPVEGQRKVLILPDFHLVREAGPALLKTIEEPPASAVFIVMAEYVPPELITIASRCVRVDFAPLAPATVTAALVAEGVSPDLAEELAVAAGGRLDRARMLAADPEFEARRRAWLSVPGRLDGRGHSAAVLADELVGLLDRSVAPLKARQDQEMAELEARNARALEVNGKVGRGGRGGLKAGVREMEDRHKREVRRQRTDELRTGLAILAGVYRDRLASASTPGAQRAAAEAVGLIAGLGAALANNPGELLALQALLARLGRQAVTA
ncbi:ATP-binding protein [Acidiferrimicrobium sp. IK]|uniref:DNA polymerase III subunit delta' n=1 Tax=Acidiferrimicrobium sp. IK TaxID=2871700 RepID=UPI0021CAE566|nr:DNA polymerase III subunit delta' [Acidiferrimicrobium sp. IK]MCU4187417.1 ATP-binding protein [Acidiferrimicrobium sp. IK]